jgi:hypothetical protein
MGENGVVASKLCYPAAAMEVVAAELGHTAGSKLYDDDGRLKRTGKDRSSRLEPSFIHGPWLSLLTLMCCLGTMWTASAHIITAVIGSGVLSLGWAIAQLGWVAGPAVMLLFSFVTYYTSALLADCYRSGDESTGKRNYTYMDAVNANLSTYHCQRRPRTRPCRRAHCAGISSNRWHQGPGLRVPAVRQHRRRRHRLHHCRLH